jgi:hypothetical protein
MEYRRTRMRFDLGVAQRCVHGKAFIWQQPQPSAETTVVTDATPGRDPRPSTPHRAASCARAAALRSIVPSSPAAVGRSHGRGWLVVWLVAFLFASVAPLRPSFPCMLLVPPSDDSIQNLNPGQDTRQQTAKRTHERRHEGTHERTRRRTPANHQHRPTNQPTSHTRNQPTKPPPRHSHAQRPSS